MARRKSDAPDHKGCPRIILFELFAKHVLTLPRLCYNLVLNSLRLSKEFKIKRRERDRSGQFPPGKSHLSSIPREVHGSFSVKFSAASSTTPAKGITGGFPETAKRAKVAGTRAGKLPCGPGPVDLTGSVPTPSPRENGGWNQEGCFTKCHVGSFFSPLRKTKC